MSTRMTTVSDGTGKPWKETAVAHKRFRRNVFLRGIRGSSSYEISLWEQNQRRDIMNTEKYSQIKYEILTLFVNFIIV